MSVAYVNGSVVTREGVVAASVVVSDGVVVSVGGQATADEVVDVSGCVVMPGFVDLHTHLREPGKEEAETILTGSRAGARGGYTALVAMPNTNPAQDSVMVVEFVRAQGVKAGFVDVVPSGCITVGRQGKRLRPLQTFAASASRCSRMTAMGYRTRSSCVVPLNMPATLASRSPNTVRSAPSPKVPSCMSAAAPPIWGFPGGLLSRKS